MAPCMSTGVDVSDELIRVIVRCRPMNEKEKKLAYVNVVNIDAKRRCVELSGCKTEKQNELTSKVFSLDDVYDDKSKTKEIFVENTCPLVNAVLNGFNGTIFAYGQSGAGKTFTMEGQDLEKGIIPLTFEEIFFHISNSSDVQFLVRASFIEIYQDEIRDLIAKNSKKRCTLRQNKDTGVYIENVTTFVCKNVEQMKKLMKMGKQNRSTGATDLNLRSSRSHAIFTITVEITDTGGPCKGRLRVGKLNLVDLAGSERQSKTSSEGQRLKEASKINLSLSALGNVIFALSENKNQYIPYRDSKLTRLLKDSLGGNSKTLIIANIGPSSSNYEESLNTLRFASRARQITNKPHVNEDPEDALLRKYQEEISRLKALLAEREAEKNLRKRIKSKAIETKGDTLTYVLSTDDVNDFFDNNIRSEHDLNTRIHKKEEVEETYFKEVAKRIEELESKLLTGSCNIVEYTDIQQQVIQAKSKEIKKVIEREREIEELIELQDETTGEVKEEYSSLKQEIEAKRKKITKIHNKFKNICQEINDVKEEFNKDREDLLATETELVRELKLKLLIMDNFIPNKDRRDTLPKLHFDDDLDVWTVLHNVEPPLLPRQKSRDLFRVPIAENVLIYRRKVNHLYTCHKSHENLLKSSRYKAENILQLDLYRHESTTKDLETEKVSYELKSKFLKACQEEQDLNIDTKHGIQQFHKLRERDKKLSKTTRLKTSQDSIPVYPKPRGLVPK